MAAAKKKLTPQQQRDRRSKIILAVVGVVFLGVLALQLPKLLKGSGGSSAAPPPVAPAATSTTGAAVAVAGGAAVPTQLTSFSRFANKDPFQPRVKVAGGTTGGSSTASSGSQPPPAPKPAAKPTPPPISFSVAPQKPAQPTGPRVPAVLLTVDGKKRVVLLGAVFPAKHPVFRVVGLTADAVLLRLVGGSLANGKQTLKVLRGHPVTLVNTTAGTRLVLGVVKPTTAPKPAAPAVAVVTTAPAATTAGTTTTSG